MNDNNATVSDVFAEIAGMTAAARRLKMAMETDAADHVMAAIDDSGDGFHAGVLWAALMIGTELRGIRTAVEDIAAALLAPVADDEGEVTP